MKRFLSLLLVAAPIAAQTVTQPPRETAPLETISVTGTGKATLTPDRFSFSAGVQTTAPTVEEAVNQNNTKMASVRRSIPHHGGATRAGPVAPWLRYDPRPWSCTTTE